MAVQRQFNEHKTSHDRAGLPLEFSTGKMANLADGSITITLGENVFLVTNVMNRDPRPESDFLPLMVDFRESYSAAGKIGGGRFRKREGRPSDEAILYARMTDRAMRPLFPKGMINDMVISLTPLALDMKQDLGVISIIGASLATAKGGIPFAGPVGAVRIAYVDGNFVINPTLDQIEKGTLNLLVAGPKDNVNMIECDGKQVPNEILDQAWDLAQEHINKVIERQEAFLAKAEIKDLSASVVFNKPSDALIARTKNILTEDKLAELHRDGKDKSDFGVVFKKLENAVLEAAEAHIKDDENNEYSHSKVKMAVFQVMKKHIRHRTIHEGVRLDGRDINTIRPLHCEVDVLPQVHGSGLFRRGDTQVLSTVTLGSPGDAQLVDTMEITDGTDHYMHHYNFAPYSVNDARGTRGPGRREVGHGKLAEKALEYMIPDRTSFPYTIRVVSECLSSGGSTSMGATCGSTLSLLAAGVPLVNPVSGIAMGMMSDLEDDGITIKDYQVLTDIMGTEDFTGDMDFKVAGTKQGITAIQLDTKLKGVPVSIIKEVMIRANAGRDEILDFMLKTIDGPRSEVNQYAPKIHIMSIKADKIKEVIGKGGETINKIIEQAGGVKIDIEEDGSIFLTHQDKEVIKKAVDMIEEITMEFEKGIVYDAKITRIEAYGAFIAFPNGKTGLIHISNIGQGITGDLNQRFKIGDAVKVTLLNIDDKGKMSFKREVEAPKA